MKILMLNYEFPPLGGGAAPVTEQLTDELSKQGHDIDVVTMHYKKLKKTEIKSQKVRIYRVNAFRKKQSTSNFIEMFFYVITAYFKCLELFKKNKYDMIHVHFIIPTGIVAYLLKKKYNVKYIITSHGSDVPGYNPDRFIFLHKLIFPIWKIIAKNAECITTPSYNLKKLILSNHALTNIKPVPNAIYFKKVKTKKQNIILYAGRLFQRKGVQHLIKAVDNLKGWKIIIAGEGPYKSGLMKISKTVNADIEFTGWLSKKQLINYYKKSSIFVFPSSQESFGMVLVEAMMYGNAVITTSDTGAKEVVEDAGILIDKRTPLEIRKAIDSLISNPGKLKKFQKKSIVRAEIFSWKNVIKKYLAVYKKVV